jgi:uncharacterized RDD family membrane protein YckC
MISALPTFLGSVRSPAVPCVFVCVFTLSWVFLHFCGRFIPVGIFTFTVGVFISLWAFINLWAFLYKWGRFYLTVGILYITVGILFHCGRLYSTVGVFI